MTQRYTNRLTSANRFDFVIEFVVNTTHVVVGDIAEQMSRHTGVLLGGASEVNNQSSADPLLLHGAHADAPMLQTACQNTQISPAGKAYRVLNNLVGSFEFNEISFFQQRFQLDPCHERCTYASVWRVCHFSGAEIFKEDAREVSSV